MASTVTTHPQIVKFPHEALSRPCEPVTRFDGELRELVTEMFRAMYSACGVGLAANQLGISKQVAVIDVWHGEKTLVLVNPRITDLSRNKKIDSEGCLSVPGIFKPKERALTCLCEAQDEFGTPITVKGTWLFARAIQHECDHLAGRLCLDQEALDEFAKREIVSAPHAELERVGK